MALRFVTDETMREAIGDAAIDPESFGQVLDDARRIYGLVRETPWVTEASLRADCELDPDRVNIALEVLRASGQLHAVELTEKQIPEEA